jgi:hypothetical protein
LTTLTDLSRRRCGGRQSALLIRRLATLDWREGGGVVDQTKMRSLPAVRRSSQTSILTVAAPTKPQSLRPMRAHRHLSHLHAPNRPFDFD